MPENQNNLKIHFLSLKHHTSISLCSNIYFLCWVTNWHLYLTYSSVRSLSIYMFYSILTNSSSTRKSLICFSRGPDKPQKRYPVWNFVEPKETGWECHVEHRRRWGLGLCLEQWWICSALNLSYSIRKIFLVSTCVRSVL